MRNGQGTGERESPPHSNTRLLIHACSQSSRAGPSKPTSKPSSKSNPKQKGDQPHAQPPRRASTVDAGARNNRDTQGRKAGAARKAKRPAVEDENADDDQLPEQMSEKAKGKRRKVDAQADAAASGDEGDVGGA